MLILFISPLFTTAQEASLPWLELIDPQEKRASLHSLKTQAEVTVSDGLQYATHTLFHDPQRAVFKIQYPDRMMTQGVEGKYYWTYDGHEENEAPDFVEGFVLGHQFHAQLLFFDQLHASTSNPETTEFEGNHCKVISTSQENTPYKFYYTTEGIPLAIEIVRTEEPNIISTFSDWREVAGLHLPYQVLINDGERVFKYLFTTIILNEGSFDDFRAPDTVLTDEQKLMRLHRVIMDDHFFGNMDRLNDRNGDNLTIVSQGAVYEVSKDESSAMMNRMINNRDYTVYNDLIRPKIKISQDGSLAWVIVKILAKGIRYDEEGKPKGPLEFTSAWIELYEKVQGQWKMIGNVSNFKEGLK